MSESWYLIAGGSSGIGFATANLLCGQGNHVVLVSHNADKLDACLKKLPVENAAVCVNLSDPNKAGEAISFCRKQGIVLDGLVYTAGCSPLCLLKDQTYDLALQTFNLNYFSFLEMVKYFYTSPNAKDGAGIVGVASITASGAGYRQAIYGSSKAAMISAVHLAANELWNRKMRINCISPGVVDTPMVKELAQKSDNLLEKVRLSQKLGLIPPEEIACAIQYLLSDKAAHISGMNFTLDGGASLK